MIGAVIDKHYAELEKLYMAVHAEPELGFEVPKTAKRLADEWRAAGFEVTEKVGGHGVVGVMQNGVGKVLMVRADMDALPILEQTEVPFASKVVIDGVPLMHACGHDVNVTCVVGVARVMAELKDRWKGTLVLVGQPAEEKLQGAKAMLDDGLFERFPRPDYCLAQHVDCALESGKMKYVSGYAMANIDNLEVVIRGFGGHGASPHSTKDPIVIAAQVILALQTIVSREVVPLEAAVVSVGSIHAGSAPNIIPDEVKMQLTVRTYKDDVRAAVKKAIERIVKGQALAAGVPVEREPIITWTKETCPATYNDPVLVERVVGAIKSVIGAENVVVGSPVMGSEDFGLFGRMEPKVPIFMMGLGSVEPQKMAKGGVPGVHTPYYLPDWEATLRLGVMGMTIGALELLR